MPSRGLHSRINGRWRVGSFSGVVLVFLIVFTVGAGGEVARVSGAQSPESSEVSVDQVSDDDLPRSVSAAYIQSATITITGDDGPEGHSGTRPMIFTVSIAGSLTWPFTATYRTRGAGEGDPRPPGSAPTATPWSDYASEMGSFNLNHSGDRRTFSVDVIGDTVVEPDEFFWFEIASNHFSVYEKVAGIIRNDDQPQVLGLKAVVLGGTGVVSNRTVAEIEALTGTPAIRIWGADRFATAAAISSLEYPTGAPVAFIAVGDNFPDALAGGVPAALRGGPVLLTRSNAIPGATITELRRLRPDQIVVLGGHGAVSDAVVGQLAKYTAGSVSRLAGSDRYRTAVAISKDTFPTGAAVAFVAVGDNFPDALAGGAVAALNHGPILLTRTATVPGATLGELIRLGVDEIVILGGTGVISRAVEVELAAAVPGVSISRVAGPDRYATAAAISRSQFRDGKGGLVFIAIGSNFPDALAGMPSAARSDAPILLVTGRDAPPASTASEIVRLRP